MAQPGLGVTTHIGIRSFYSLRTCCSQGLARHCGYVLGPQLLRNCHLGRGGGRGRQTVLTQGSYTGHRPDDLALRLALNPPRFWCVNLVWTTHEQTS